MSGALVNPYAPPSEAVPPSGAAAPLPAGLRRYRLDPAAHAKAATREVLARVARVGGIAIVIAVVLAVFGSGFSAYLAPFLVVFVAVLAVPAIRRARDARAPEIVTYELMASPRVLRRTLAGRLPAEILRPEVTRIAETHRGLWLLADAPAAALFVAPSIEGYAELRAELATWRPIEILGRRAGEQLWLASGPKQKPRDAVAGTSLAHDASLREELELVRMYASTAYLAHAPPAVTQRRAFTMLVLWVLLIVMFLAIWQFLSPSR